MGKYRDERVVTERFCQVMAETIGVRQRNNKDTE